MRIGSSGIRRVVNVKFGRKSFYELTFTQLKTFFDLKKANKLPLMENWPALREQQGPCCGLLALSIALHYAGIADMPVYAESTQPSLLSVAKSIRKTTIGEILDVNCFAHILQTVMVPHGSAIQSSPESFVGEICKQLDASNTVIVSCDLGTDVFPGVSGGARAHWALIFGYVYLTSMEQDEDESEEEREIREERREPYFLVAQYGKYYLWSAEKLRISNQQQADVEYPKSEAFGVYVARGNSREYDFHPRHGLDADFNSNASLHYIPSTALRNFYCTLFSIPVENPVSSNLVVPTKKLGET